MGVEQEWRRRVRPVAAPMLRPAASEVPDPPPPPALSPENRQPVVLATLVTLVLLAAASVTLAWRSVGEAEEPRVDRGYRGEVNAEVTFNAVTFDPEGSRVYAATSTSVEVWHTVTHRRLGAFAAGAPVTAIVVSPDGRTLATAGDDGAVRLWDTGTRREVGDPLRAEGMGRPSVLAISPDGTLVAAAGEGGTALWNIDTRAYVGLLASASGGHSGVAFSPDGARVATGEINGGTVTLWRTATREADGEPLVGNQATGPTHAVAFDTSGTLLADGCADTAVFVWNLATRDRFEFRGHEDAVRHVVLTGDGRTLITAGVRDVRIWDVQSATQIGFPIPVKPDGSDDVKDFALSPDGGTLAIVRDHRIQFWSLAAAAKR